MTIKDISASLAEYRELFPVTDHHVYMNHAATSPLSLRVIAAMQEHLQERSESCPDNWPQTFERSGKLRSLIAELIGTTPDRLALLQNTCSGLNVIAAGLDWQAGDEILIPEGEFPANVYPFTNLERFGVKVRFLAVPEGGLTPEILERSISPRTRLLTLSFVEFLSGYKADLAIIGKICHANDIIFVVDGIQGVGAIPIDVEEFGIDALANGMHKWMMCPQGLAFLYLSRELQGRVHPTHLGWVGVKKPEEFLNYPQELSEEARRYELGGFNSAGVAGAVAAVSMLLELSPQNTYVQLKTLTSRLMEGLEKLGYRLYTHSDLNHRSGIVTFHPRDKNLSERLYQRLTEQNITISMRSSMIRVAPHFYNTVEEIDRVLSVCDGFIRHLH